MRVYRSTSTSRYYHLRVVRDLFGQRVLIRSWGGLRNRFGGIETEPLVRGRLREIDRERAAHGYQRVNAAMRQSG